MEQKKPFFSIIIPTYNRPDKLADCLKSLSRLDYPYDQFEVILIDDGRNTSLQPVVARFFDFPDHAIGGRTLNFLSENSYSTTSQIILDVVYAYYDSSNDQAPFFPSGNLAVSADQFRAIGGFDPTFTISEDRDLCDRWLSHDFGMTYAPEALVYHNHPLTFLRFLAAVC
jgi:GT2 family glycosyltransferase